MKFQVSVLSDKGTKKLIATVDADRFEEESGESRNAFIHSYQTRVRFYSDNGNWRKSEDLVASLLLASSYVIEQVSL
jgi:hypothetical protein